MHKIFVYGTLKQHARDTHKVKGRMWSLGPFPCMMLGGDKEIPGQIINVTDAEMNQLDRYESVPTMYTRDKTKAFSIETGKEEDVWVYQWANDIEDLTEIDSWENHVH